MSGRKRSGAVGRGLGAARARGPVGASILGLAIVLFLGTAVVPPAHAARYYRHRTPSQFDLVIEGGVTTPFGDLGDDYFSTIKGAGAETGFDIGARVRQRWDSGWALSPAFHYENFGDFVGFSEANNADIKVSTSILRYEIDVQYFFPENGSDIQPFLSAGPGLYVNRYKDQLSTEDFPVTNTFNALGVSLGGGFRVGGFELAAEYHINRFSTARLPGGDQGRRVVDYNYDFLTITAGFALPLQQ
jgi:hypothetical protein